MTVTDISYQDRQIIERSCYEFDLEGDIAGRRNCISAKSAAAVAGQQVVDVSDDLPPIPGKKCDLPWNK
jgi:hypothetical protein